MDCDLAGPVHGADLEEQQPKGGCRQQQGGVKAVGKGKATITVKTANGKTAKVKITVK